MLSWPIGPPKWTAGNTQPPQSPPRQLRRTSTPLATWDGSSAPPSALMPGSSETASSASCGNKEKGKRPSVRPSIQPVHNVAHVGAAILTSATHNILIQKNISGRRWPSSRRRTVSPSLPSMSRSRRARGTLRSIAVLSSRRRSPKPSGSSAGAGVQALPARQGRAFHLGSDGQPCALRRERAGPDVDPFMLHVYAALSEKERAMIASRTRDVLKSAKARGKALGSFGRGCAGATQPRRRRCACGRSGRDSQGATAEGRSIADVAERSGYRYAARRQMA